MKPRILSTARLSFPLATALAALFNLAAPSNLQAAIVFWDGAGGNVNWSTVNNWGTSGANITSNPAAIPGSADDVVFYSTGATQLTTNIINQAFTLQSLTFGNSRTGAVTIGGTSVLTLNGLLNYNSATFSSGTVAGLTTPTTLRTGIYVQSGSGATTISAPITLGNAQQWVNNSANTLLIQTGALTNGANTLTVGGTGNTTISSIFTGSGAGGVTKVGAGTLTLSGVNTYSGTTTVTTGTLRATTSASALGAGLLSLGGGTLQLADNTGLNFARNTTVTATSTITADRTTTLIDTSATQTLGTLSIGAQTLNIARGSFITGTGVGGITFGATTLTGAAIFDTAANTNLTLGAVDGAFALTKQGLGTLTLSASSTYDGGTNVNAGTLSFASGSLGTTGNITVNGGTLQWGTGNTSDISSRLTLVTAGSASLNTNNQTVAFASGTNNVTSTLTKTGTGTLTMNGNNLHDGLTTVTGGGILTLAGDNIGMTGGVTLNGTTAATRLNINSDTALGTGTFTISGAGNGSIANSSGATRTLSTNNAQTWGQNFAVVATNSLDMGTGAVNLGSGTRVVSVSGAVFTVGGVISGSGGIQLGGGIGTMALTNTASTYTGTTVIGNNINDTFLRVTKLANLSQPSSLGAPTTATNGVITIGNSSQPGTLELVGGTTQSVTDRQVRIGGNNNGSGNATIVNNNTDPANSLVFTNPAFNLSNATTGSSRSLTLGGSNAGANEIQGAIINNNNNVGVTVNGSGAWRLSGNNTYDGATTVAGTATLTLSGDNSGAAGGVTLSTATTVNSPRLNLNSATALGPGTLLFGGGLATDTVRLDNTSAGLVNVSTNNVFTLSRDFTFIGTQSLNLGNMTTTLGGLTTGTSRNITVTANTLTFGGTIGQAAANLGVNKLGAGTLVFSGANTYSGNTTISGGTLQIGHANALGFGARQTTATGTTTVSNGFTLDLNGSATVNEPLILNGTGIGGNGALLNTNTGATAIIGNGIAGIQQSAATNGSGYSSAPTITISGTGSGATATATLGVTALSFTGFAGGDKVYTVAPTVTISGGGGAGATATAVLSGGATGTLTGFTITNAGSGFTTIPTITFGAGTFSSGTINGSATGNDTEFTVSGLSMTAAGSGYTGTPTYTIDSGNATPGSVSLSSVTLAATSSIGGSGNITIDSVVSESGGARGLTKVGAGTVTLNGVNTYTGDTTITTGTLQLGAGSTTGSLSISSAIVNNANLTINRSNTATQGTDFSGADITGTGSFTQAGAGTTTLNVANSYSGGTTVTAGTLVLTNASAAGTAGISISGASSAILQIDAGITLAGNNITFSNTNAASKVVRDVAVSSAYTTGTTGTLSSQFAGGYDNTTAQILDGTRTLGTTLEMLFADTAPGATNDAIRRSDVFTTAGTSTDTYVIQLSTSVALAGDSVLGWLNGTNWVHAGGTFFASTAFADLATHPLGSYGFSGGNVWAVVDHGGSFAAVPEPTSAFVGLLIGAGLLRRRRVAVKG